MERGADGKKAEGRAWPFFLFGSVLILPVLYPSYVSRYVCACLVLSWSCPGPGPGGWAFWPSLGLALSLQTCSPWTASSPYHCLWIQPWPGHATEESWPTALTCLVLTLISQLTFLCRTSCPLLSGNLDLKGKFTKRLWLKWVGYAWCHFSSILARFLWIVSRGKGCSHRLCSLHAWRFLEIVWIKCCVINVELGKPSLFSSLVLVIKVFALFITLCKLMKRSKV